MVDENQEYLLDNATANKSVNVSLRQKLLMVKYDGKNGKLRFDFSKWVRVALTEEGILEWIEKNKKPKK